VTDILTRIDETLDAACGDYSVSDDAMRWAPDAIGTRARDLADGALVAVPEALAREAGFRWPIALTHAAWDDCVAWTEADEQRKGALQDETGRLWDVLWMTKMAIRRLPHEPDVHTVRVRMVRVPRHGLTTSATRVELVVMVGPGDDGEPVITISLAEPTF
jgi:hypothetical protein